VTAPEPPAPRRRRFWVSLGEGVAVLAVAIAGLSYWDSHREHAAADRRAAEQAGAQPALVLRASQAADGRRLAIDAAGPEQVIVSQRYLFPAAVLSQEMEVTAARPQIDLGWLAGGLQRRLDQTHARGGGEARLPVGIVTSYVDGGRTFEDRSLYEVGFSWRSHLIGGRQLALQGLALRRRAVATDLRAAVESRWKREAGSGGAT
jgi:hypothetical protein